MSPKNLLNCRLDRRFYDGIRGLKEEVMQGILDNGLTQDETGVVSSLPGH